MGTNRSVGMSRFAKYYCYRNRDRSVGTDLKGKHQLLQVYAQMVLRPNINAGINAWSE